MTGYDRRGHIVIPEGLGLWTAILDSDSDYAADQPLSDEAVAVRSAGLSFPKFGAPGQEVLKLVMAERARKSGSKHRPPGRDKIQNALTELRKKGYYAVRKETLGRRVGNKKPPWATVLSFANEPWKHVEELESLTADEVWWHFRRMKAATAHLVPVDKTVERRLSRAG